jgi:hypothetical protein
MSVSKRRAGPNGGQTTERTYLVLELAWVLARLEHHCGRPFERLSRERERHRPRQPRPHAAVRESLDHQEAVCWARSGEACHRVHQLLGHFLGTTDRREPAIANGRRGLSDGGESCALRR